jgi:hypothetical protein
LGSVLAGGRNGSCLKGRFLLVMLVLTATGRLVGSEFAEFEGAACELVWAVGWWSRRRLAGGGDVTLADARLTSGVDSRAG